MNAPAAPAMSGAPQLGGLFAGGMPKLKKTSGVGIDTGGMSEPDYPGPFQKANAYFNSISRIILPFRPRVKSILCAQTTYHVCS